MENLETFTVEEFQANFDALMNRVENGESFIITSDEGNAVIVPYKEIVNLGVDDYVELHRDHEEGC
jgi:prevent-host-death family protein